MKKVLILAAIIAVAAVAVIVLKRGRPQEARLEPAPVVEEAPKSAFPSPSVLIAKRSEHGHTHDHGHDHGHSHGPAEPPHEHEEAPVAEPSQDVRPAPEQPVVDVPGDRPLATVNNQPIILADLVPVRAGDQGKPVQMTSEEFQARLNQAIETEVTFQAAREQGVSLNDDQKGRLAAIRAQRQADIEHYRSQGMMWTSITDEQVNLTERYIEARMLQQSLLEKAGVPTTPVLTDEDIERYYLANKSHYGELPADAAAREEAWQAIKADITALLMPYLQENYSGQTQQLLEQLKGQANIQTLFSGGADG